MKELCTGQPKEWPTLAQNRKLYQKSPGWSGVQTGYCGYNTHGVVGAKRPKLTCSVCGRRIFASVYNDHDGDAYWSFPPHKPKFWWKKKK